jgi:DUF1680 family protein
MKNCFYYPSQYDNRQNRENQVVLAFSDLLNQSHYAKIFSGLKCKLSQFPSNSSKAITISNSKLYALEGKVMLIPNESWTSQFYRPVNQKKEMVSLQLVPYYAWGNRGKGDMSVWLPIGK